MNAKVDLYIQDGCGRCPYYATPQCKVRGWPTELETLRQAVLDSGLKEELKWGAPCYTHDGKNVVMVSALRDCVTISFFKGALLRDEAGVLEKPGERSQAARIVRFRNVEQIRAAGETLKAYIREAVELEKAGQKVVFKKNPEPVPEELLRKFEESPALEEAFYALTPGRQRSHLIYFTQSGQSSTRIVRIEKCAPKILNGEGLNDKYGKPPR